MPDFLTRRNGTWHFARRVPTEFAHLDRRGVVKHSTKIRIASDRAAVRASRVAEKFNSSLEQHWRVLADSDSKEGVDSYNEARRRARQLGFDYIENAHLVAGPAAERLERLETLVAKDLVNDEGAREAVLGLKKKASLQSLQDLRRVRGGDKRSGFRSLAGSTQDMAQCPKTSGQEFRRCCQRQVHHGPHNR